MIVRWFQKKPEFFLAVIFVAITWGIYANSLPNGFVWDDYDLIVRNDRVRSLGRIPGYFCSTFMPAQSRESVASYYRPLVSMTFAVDYAAGGPGRPWVFHLTNVLAYSVCVVVVFVLFRLLLENRWAAWLGALLFATHSIHTESVAWIAGRTDVLSAVFMCVALLCLLRGRRAESGGASALGFAAAFAAMLLALFSKEVALSLVPIYVVFELTWGRSKGFEAPASRRLAAVLVTGASAACYVLIRVAVTGGVGTGVGRGLSAFSPAGLATAAKCIFAYLGKLALPVHLSAHFEVAPYETLAGAGALLALAGGIGLGVLCVLAAVRDGRTGFAVWWIWLALAPALNLVPLPETAAERFAFVPSIGFCLLVAIMAERMLTGQAGPRSTVRIGVGAVLLICFCHGALTVARNPQWRSEYALCSSSVKTAPTEPRAHMALGTVYAAQMGLHARAVQHNLRAIELSPAMGYPHNQLGKSALLEGRVEESLLHFKRAAARMPDSPVALTNLAQAYMEFARRNDHQQAWKLGRLAVETALQKNPQHPDAHFFLGYLYMARTRDFARAAEQFARAAELDTSYAEASFMEGEALKNLGRPDRARAAFREALRRRPRYYEPHYALALITLERNDLPGALREVQQAITMRPTREAQALRKLIRERMGDR